MRWEQDSSKIRKVAALRILSCFLIEPIPALLIATDDKCHKAL